MKDTNDNFYHDRISFLILLLSGLGIACGSDTKFSAQSIPILKHHSEPTETVTPRQADVIPEDPPVNPPVDPVDPVDPVEPPEDPPPITKPPTLLILDFQSGWWGEFQGNYNKKVIAELMRVFEGKIEIEYHHIIPSSSSTPEELKFIDEDWRHFVEIWILSGSETAGDMELNDPYFKKIVQKLVESKAGFLIGAGNGSVMHANPILEALGFRAIFVKTAALGLLEVNFEGNSTTAETRIDKQSNKLIEHELFTYVESLADIVKTAPFGNTENKLKGDYFIDDDNFFTIALDTDNRNSIGVTKAGKKIILDADLPRFYTILNDDENMGTLRYMYNIVDYLNCGIAE